MKESISIILALYLIGLFLFMFWNYYQFQKKLRKNTAEYNRFKADEKYHVHFKNLTILTGLLHYSMLRCFYFIRFESTDESIKRAIERHDNALLLLIRSGVVLFVLAGFFSILIDAI